MSYAIGIDIGTTNCKVALIKTIDCSICQLEKFVTPKVDANGGVNFLVPELIDLLLKKIAICSKKIKELDKAADIAFISIASVGESGVLVRSDLTYVPYSLVWYDKRGSSYADSITNDTSCLYYKNIGIPAHSNYALFKILWHKSQGEKLVGAHWLPLADFVAWYLTGVFGIDNSLASRLYALDIKNKTLFDEVLQSFEVPKELFSELIPSGTMRGSIKSDIANDLELNSDCKVCVAGHDHMVGSVAAGIQRESELLNSTGTSEGLLQIVGSAKLDTDAFNTRLSNGLYVQQGSYSLYASLPTAGYTLEWLSNLLAIPQDELFGIWAPLIHKHYLDDDFESKELIVVPHLRGSGPPNRTTYAKALVYGATEDTTREDLIFSTYLGLALEFRRLKEAMVGDNSQPIKVIGPAAKSELWMQLKADVLGCEMHACDISEAVVRGTVLVGSKSLGSDCTFDYQDKIYLSNKQRHELLEHIYKKSFVPLSLAIATYEDSRIR